MQKKTRSILEELETLYAERDQRHVIENRAANVIASAIRLLESMGITPHVIDFRCRGFWDGGLHCLTTDIHREGPCLDYWPGRGPNGIYQ